MKFENILNNAYSVVKEHEACIFKKELPITEDTQIFFDNKVVKILTRTQKSATFLRKFFANVYDFTKKWQFEQINIFWEDSSRHYQIPINSNLRFKGLSTMQVNNVMPLIIVPGVQIGEMKLSLPILRVLFEFCEYPERKYGLVRCTDERQVALSESSAALIKGCDLQEGVQRKRKDYWYLPDLEAFEREAQLALEPNNQHSILEFSFRGVSKDGLDWRRFTNRYRSIRDDYGVSYYVSQNIDVEQIAAPPQVVVRQ